ncbi:MAG: putative LPS assembly protein LptD [Rikenellaceae bacterium]
MPLFFGVSANGVSAQSAFAGDSSALVNIASDSIIQEVFKSDTTQDGKANYSVDLGDINPEELFQIPSNQATSPRSIDDIVRESNPELFSFAMKTTDDSNFYIAPVQETLAESRTPATNSHIQEKSFLDAPIFIEFSDSLIYVPNDKNVFIHQTGKVTYQDKELASDYMAMNTESKIIKSTGVITDTTSQKVTRVTFLDGGANYIMDSMYYNMDSGKALIYGVDTQDGEGVMYGGTVKKMADNVTHMHKGRYTTCDADCPHFYLQMSKATVVPGKRTIFGPAYVVFEDVPTPLFLPFGFFPQQSKRNSGLIFPEIGEESVKGFYARDLGYYFALNDYVDLKLTGSIYSLGSWDLSAASNYKVRYKFSGSVSIAYSSDVIGDKSSPDYVESRGFKVQWTHTQDSKFSPSSSLSASVNFTSNSSYNKYNADNLTDYLSSSSSSSVAYSKSWSGTPFSLSASANYSQNFTDSTVSVVLPNFTFNVSSFAPLKRKNAVGKERWYEKITMTYKTEFQNKLNSYDQEELFTEQMFKDLQMGVRHTIPISTSFSFGGVFNLSPSINYVERWYFDRVNQTWDPTSESIVKDTTSGFYRVYNYNVALSMNTKVYGTYTIGKNKPTIFRHVMSPTVSVSWAPDFGDEKFGFWKTVQNSTDGGTTTYSPYSSSIYGTTSSSATASVSFSVQNTLEAKVPSDKDTTGYQKISIIDALSLSGSYNFLADSMNLSTISASLRFPVPFTNGYSMQLSATFDPYCLSESGTRYNKYVFEEGKFLRLTALSFSASYGFKSKAASKSSDSRSGQPAINNPNNPAGTTTAAMKQEENYYNDLEEMGEYVSPLARAQLVAGEYYDFSIPWSLNLSYNFSYSNTTGTPNLVQTIDASGSVNLTDKWAISMSCGYDIEMGEITPGTVQVTRDLHCFQMSFSWVPTGFRSGWSFTLQAKSSMLADLLKYEKNSSYLDNYYY